MGLDKKKRIMKWILLVLFVVGGYVCCWNFYLSFLRYLAHRLRGGKRGDYQFVSGVPVVGSLLVVLPVRWLWQPAWLLPLAMILVVIDTGGLHWFAGSMFYHGIIRRAGRGE